MWNFILETMQNYPDSKLFSNEIIYTYSQIINMAEEHGEILKNKLHKTAKCAILCDSGINCFLAILSCWYAGLVPIPLSVNYGVENCIKIIELTQPDILIVDTDKYRLCPYQYNITNKNIVFEKNEIIRDDSLNDVAIIMCTSGTTGIPKGIMITNYGLRLNILKINDYFKINIKDRIMIARPVYHCAVLTGELLVSVFNGLDIGFLDEIYNPYSLLQFALKNNITILCGTPTLFNHLSELSQKNNIKHLIKKIAISGECLNKRNAINIRKGFPDAEIYNVYGLTEASPRVSYLPPEKYDAYSESVGIPLEGIQIKIVDQNYNELPINTKGLIMIKTPCIMKGYYKNPEMTKKVINNKWLNTGDIGFIDNNKYLYILSRADDMIIKGGMNIYPKEIETQIELITQIKECIAYGKKSVTGQVIALDILLNDEYKTMTKKEIMILLSTILPAYQMPSEINITDIIKKNASGKIIRPR